MTFNLALAPRIPNGTPLGEPRIAYPIQHGTDWISPFVATPTDPNDPGYKKITVTDEAGVVRERLFKIIDTAHYQDPILMEDWPTNPLDPAQGIAILSCCNNAFKINSIQACFFAIHPKTCPMCRAGGFPTPSTILTGRTAPILAGPIPVGAPMGGAAPAAVPIAAPLGRQHIINPQLLKTTATASIIASFIFLRVGIELLGSAAISTATLLITFGVGSILLGTGVVLIKLSNINPNQALINKITDIIKGVLIGATFNGVGTLAITAFKYSIITSTLVGSGAFIATIAIAILYSKYLC